VRLRYGYIVECIGYDKATDTVRCTYDPDTRSGTPRREKVKVKGNIPLAEREPCARGGKCG